jgi:hypothetical protein
LGSDAVGILKEAPWNGRNAHTHRRRGVEEGLQHDSRANHAVGSDVRTRGLRLGIIAGLAATFVIDLIMIGYLLFTGQPAENGFAVIGDTAAGLFSLFGIEVAGGVTVGLVWHYVIGLILGVIFGVAVTRIDALHPTSLRKGVGLGILYAEVISLPILVMPPIILNWTTSATEQLFGFYFVMHAIWGILLGVVVSYGLRSTTAARQG